MPRSIFARIIGFLGPLCVLALSLQAQDQKQGGLNQTIKFEGKIAGAQGGVVKVITEDKKEYLVKLPDDVKNVSYSGTASLPWLSRGLFVR